MYATAADVHFELHTRRHGRWLLDACFADEDEAREEAERAARRGEGDGVRLVREVHLPGMSDPVVTVLLDTTRQDPPVDLRARPGAEDAACETGSGRSVLGATHRHPHRHGCASDADARDRPPADGRMRALFAGVSVLVAAGVVAAIFS
jgi:hypothetical protein